MPTDRARQLWDRVRERPARPLAPPDSYPHADIAAMLRELGLALVEVMQPTQLVRARVHKAALAYTTAPVRVVALPTVLLIQVGTTAFEVDVTGRTTDQLNIADRVDHITRLIEAGAITPTSALQELARARRMPPRFPAWVRILGYVITTLGFGMIMNPTWASLWGHALLGAVVGVILVAAEQFPSLNAIAPTLAATAVTVLATWFVADAANDGLLRVIAPALVALLPGMALTVGAMELASSSIIAGSSRLIYGAVQTMLLVFGVSLGIAVAGRIPPQAPSAQLGPWAFYAAIVVAAVGLYLFLSAPPGSLLWLTAAIGVALIGQRLGGLFLSSAHAGALGAALVLPFAIVASRLKTAPTAMVMLLAAFWALVPGALGFESLSAVVSGGSHDIEALSRTVGAVFSIALGTLVSWSILDAIGSRRRLADDDD